ncbi:hypothetical protein Droror1_Dr00003090 [Drosera rotundifolia]
MIATANVVAAERNVYRTIEFEEIELRLGTARGETLRQDHWGRVVIDERILNRCNGVLIDDDQLLWLWIQVEEAELELGLNDYELMNWCERGDTAKCLYVLNDMEEMLDIELHDSCSAFEMLCKVGYHVKLRDKINWCIGNHKPIHEGIYNCLIAWHLDGNDDERMHLCKWMVSQKLGLDKSHHGAVITSLCKSERLDEALGWFNLHQLRIDTDVLIPRRLFPILLDAAGKAGRGDLMKKIMRKMHGLQQFSTDEQSRNTIVQTLRRSGLMHEALKFFKQASYHGNERILMADTYLLLIDGLFKQGKDKDASRLIDEALWLINDNRNSRTGRNWTADSYLLLMDGLLKHGRDKQALKLWELMDGNGIRLTTDSMRLLCVNLCRCGEVELAPKAFGAGLALAGADAGAVMEDMVLALCETGKI